MSDLVIPPIYSPITKDQITQPWYEYLVGLNRSIGNSGTSSVIVTGGIPSLPTTGNHVVTNLYVDATTGMLQVEFDDSTAGPIDTSDRIASSPTAGNYQVTNLYVNAVTGALEIEYDDGT